MSDNLEDGASAWAEALAEGLIDLKGNLTAKGREAEGFGEEDAYTPAELAEVEGRYGAFPGRSPFYNQEDQLALGKHAFEPNEDKPDTLKRNLEKVAGISAEEIYQRLDRAIAQAEQAGDFVDLYDLRDDIYRTLR